MMTPGDYLKRTKFIIDVSDLDSDAKLAIWKHFWDYSKSQNPDWSVYSFDFDNFFTVYSKSDLDGNISRGCTHPATYYGDELRARTFKPILETETVYRVKGLDMPEEIEISGVKYRRIP